MHRIDTPTAQRDKFGAGKNGFTNGDPSTGRRATDLNSDMWDAVQEEIANAIELTGIPLDKSRHNQLYLAIQKAITERGFLKKSANLSDLVDPAAARANLHLGELATVNYLTADKVGAYSKNEADTKFLPKAGGRVEYLDINKGLFIGDGLKVGAGARVDKNVSVGEDLWVDRNATVAGSLKVGNSTHASDGNIMGSRWGGKWLWDAIIEQVQGRVDWGTFNREVGARATNDYVNQNFVQNMRLTAERQIGAGGVRDYRGGNTVMTGFTNHDGDYSPEGLFWSELQIFKNGQWMTIGRG